MSRSTWQKKSTREVRGVIPSGGTALARREQRFAPRAIACEIRELVLGVSPNAFLPPLPGFCGLRCRLEPMWIGVFAEFVPVGLG